MRTVFVSHNDLGLACLEELDRLGADIRAVLTRPELDRISDQTDFAAFTEERDVPLHRVESLNTDEWVDRLAGYDPELLFVVGWSRLVERRIIDVPSVAAFGMHPAPLPRGRGRAPIAWSLIKGLDETALTMFHLVEEADAGDIAGQVTIPIDKRDDAASLYEKVVDAGRTLVREVYPQVDAGEVPRTPQDDDAATWWPRRRPEHGLIDWTHPPEEVYDWIRGQSHPYPGAFTFLDGRRVTVWAANPPSGDRAFVEPGELVYREGDVLGVGAWEGVVELTRVEIDGQEMPAGALVTDQGFAIGDRFAHAATVTG
ncbi:methionyl-tRNA formyltransferase [Salinigranum sp. GCM10025319]|uniref:methionyl-tRNA formyltransferase n=1 Tax=Salinigranum sp. GCM10025319 TaxID=3252687 RepID=UPI00361A981C